MSKDIRDETTAMTTQVLVSDVMNSPIVHAGPNDDLVTISKLMTNA